MSGLVKLFKVAAILSDGLHFVFWVLWTVLCVTGFLKLQEINPGLTGWKLALFFSLPFFMLGLLIYDALRLWFASEKHRMLWLSMLIRTFSVIMMVLVFVLLFGPTLYQVYYRGEF